MDSSYLTEAEAATLLPGRLTERALRRWRQQGRVPYLRTPGGRIFYTVGMLTEISAAMRVEPKSGGAGLSACGHTRPDMSGELGNDLV